MLVGARATFLGGVLLRCGGIVGAAVLANEDVPPDFLLVGVPVKILPQLPTK